MKQGWQIVQIGDIAKVFNGNSINANEKKERYEGLSEGYPFIATKDVSTDGVVDYDNGVKIPYDTDLKIAKPDTVFVCAEGGSAGRKVAYIDRNVCFGNKLFAIEPKSKMVIGQFLYYVVQHSGFKKQFRSLMTGIIGGVSIKKFNAINIILPPLSDQQRIVTLLDAEFAKIDALKANAERNLQNAKDLFQAALKKELSPKEGWKISTIQQMLKLTSGDNLTTKNIVEGNYPVYGGNGIMGYHNRYNLDGENVIVGRVGAWCGNVRLVKGKIWYTDNAFLVNDKTKSFYLPYLAYVLENANLRRCATQAAQPVISNVSIKDVVLSLPSSILIQQSIVARLDALNDKCKALQANYEKTIALCDDLKQALLRKAFNGEI